MLFTKIVNDELYGLYGQKVLEDMSNIIRLYDFYEGKGQDWETSEGLDYHPTKVVTNLCKKLIKQETRFMFGRPPKLRVLDESNEVITEYQQRLDEVLEDNLFSERLTKGLRDCLIGKRIAIKLTGGLGKPIGIHIYPSLEFVYEAFDDDADRLRKIIFFYNMNESTSFDEQRIWRQKYELCSGRCFVTEGVYNGRGELVGDGECVNTGLPFIPCRVIINDGLTGDPFGESDVEEIMAGQNAYNRLKSDDMDALRFNMFPQRVAVDADAGSLEQIVLAPGALVDLITDPDCSDDGKQAKLKMLETSFDYDHHFENAINRIKRDMYELLSIPNLSSGETWSGAQSNGGVNALYRELKERCEERWTVWEPALQWMCRTIFAMLTVYGDTRYDAPCKIHVEHLYPIFEDGSIEREIDLKEVVAGVRSRKSYREKWNLWS